LIEQLRLVGPRNGLKSLMTILGSPVHQATGGGFQRLIEDRPREGGMVLSLDASRLARNNHDWHQLLELCSLFGVLIADGERVYDPCAYHDRLAARLIRDHE
jgi:DNA invertase Pin-like site-specific DNA recombinase